jgi:tetratricopeptide (TPR) repeat protein
MRTRLCLLIAWVFVSISLFAQARPPGGGSGGGRGNRSTTTPDVFNRPANRDVSVEIQVTDQNSQPLNDSQLMVELTGLGGGGIQRAFVDNNGRAIFRVRGGNTFQLAITGQDIETANSSFELYPDEMIHRERIEVKFKKEASNRAPGGMVSAADLNVPPKAHSEFDKGLKEMNESRWEEAKKHFQKAIDLYPKYDWAYNNLGVVEMQLNHADAAKQAFTKAVECNDKNPDATGNLGQVKLGENDYQGAKELLGKSLIVRPKSSKTLLLMAIAQYKTNELDAALANAEKVHEGDMDKFPLAHFIAAEIREKKGDRVGAEHQYQAYLKEAPDGQQAKAAKDALARVEARN